MGCTLGDTRFDPVDVDSHCGKSGDSRFGMGVSPLPVTLLVITLVVPLFLVTFSAR